MKTTWNPNATYVAAIKSQMFCSPIAAATSENTANGVNEMIQRVMRWKTESDSFSISNRLLLSDIPLPFVFLLKMTGANAAPKRTAKKMTAANSLFENAPTMLSGTINPLEDSVRKGNLDHVTIAVTIIRRRVVRGIVSHKKEC